MSIFEDDGAIDSHEFRLLRGRLSFTGAAGLGAVGTVTIATITGQVEINRLYAYVSEALVSVSNTGTITLGVTSNDQVLIAPTTVAPGAFDLGTWWTSSAGGVTPGLDLVYSVLGAALATAGNLINTIATNNVTNGQLDYGLWWRPLSADCSLTLGPNLVAI